MAMQERKRYFVTKCQNMQALRKCQLSSTWACSDRRQPPQPKAMLSEALSHSNVTLVYSVNNCRGWHGYAEMVTKPGMVDQITVDECNSSEQNDKKSELSGISNDSKSGGCEGHVNDVSMGSSAEHWHLFRIKWQTLFLNDFGEQCLPFSSTAHLKLKDSTMINNARNWQEINEEDGLKLCELIDGLYQSLLLKRKEKERLKEERLSPAFFPPGSIGMDMNVVWDRLVTRTQSLGRVHLACAFGSQRYNLHTADSDLDMFVVYEAPAHRVLSLDPPQQTIKNRESEACDYTVHELSRYCELLHGGDPRCVETLFLHHDTIYHCSEEWRTLCDEKHHFLTRKCLDKYLRDACGSKGIKQLEKWCRQREGFMDGPVPAPICKLSYVIIRLLQNARQVAVERNLVVYRRDDSEERQVLMKIRKGQLPYQQISDLINKLLKEIDDAKQSLPDNDGDDVKDIVEKWMIQLRYTSLHAHMTDARDIEKA